MRLLTCLEDSLLVMLGVPIAPIMDPEHTSILGTPQTTNIIYYSIQITEFVALVLGFQLSSMLPPQIRSHPTRFTMPSVVASTVMSSEN